MPSEYQRHARIETSALPGRDAARKRELQAAYAGTDNAELEMLREVRAARAVDAIDLFNQLVRSEWGNFTARDKVLLNQISDRTTRLRRKLARTAKRV